MTAQVNAAENADVVFLTAEQCGRRYGISARHWRRLVDQGAAPRPVQLGRLVRWSVSILKQWEEAGCEKQRPGTARPR